MNGKQHYKVLRQSHSRSHLLEHAKSNGISWKDASHEGVNWMRGSRAIIDYLDDNSEFYLDDMDIETANTMLDHYTQLREIHKRVMFPHLRSAMAKIHAEKSDGTKSDTELLNEAHEHLDSYGGHAWREKVETLSFLTRNITYLNNRIERMEGPSS